MIHASRALLVIAALASAACGSKNAGDGTAGESAKASAAPRATVTAAPSATAASSATAAPSVTAAPSATAARATGPGAIFAGEPDVSVNLSATPVRFAGLNLLIRKPVGWTLVTDPTLGYLLEARDGSAKLLLGDAQAGSTMSAPPSDLLALTAAKDVKAGPVLSGTLGKFALPAQIGEASATIAGQKEPGKLYFFQIAVGGARDVSAIAVLRAGVKPENEKALIAAIKTMKRSGDK